MPIVTVEMWLGRSTDQKRLLIEGITDAFVKLGTPKEKVTIILKDNPKFNWAEGGKLSSDVT
jgi:4-oxalocrotonate tautomerase